MKRIEETINHAIPHRSIINKGIIVALLCCLFASSQLYAADQDKALGPKMSLFINKTTFVPYDMFALSVVVSNMTTTDKTFLQIYLQIDNYKFYWPAWSETFTEFPLQLAMDMLAHEYLLLTVMPMFTADVYGSFHAELYKNVNGAHGELLCESVVQFGLKAPTPTPTFVPTATPTENPGNGWISGHAVVHVSGASRPPDANHEKGVMFSLDGVNCETAWVRHRGDSTALFQLKGVGNTNWDDHCWGEWDYWSMLPASDGNWDVLWGVEDGRTWVRVKAPNGNEESISVPYIIAFDHITPYNSSCTRPNVAAATSAYVVSFEPDQRGSSTYCE